MRLTTPPVYDGIERKVPSECKVLLLTHGGEAFKECCAKAWGVGASRIHVWADPRDAESIRYGVLPE